MTARLPRCSDMCRMRTDASSPQILPLCTCSVVVCMRALSHDTRSRLPPFLCISPYKILAQCRLRPRESGCRDIRSVTRGRTKTTSVLFVFIMLLYLMYLQRPNAILDASNSCFGNGCGKPEIYANRFDLPACHTSDPVSRLL